MREVMNMKAPVGIRLCQVSLSSLAEEFKYAIAAIRCKKNHFTFLINLPNKYIVSILEEFDSG